MTTPTTYKKYSTIYHSIDYNTDENQQNLLLKLSKSQPVLKSTNNKEYIKTIQFYKINNKLDIFLLDITKFKIENVFIFNFKNYKNKQNEITINSKDLLIIDTDNTTNDSEINFLQNIYFAQRCEGFNDNSKIKGKEKYGLFFIEKGTYFLTLSEKKCFNNLLIINVL